MAVVFVIFLHVLATVEPSELIHPPNLHRFVARDQHSSYPIHFFCSGDALSVCDTQICFPPLWPSDLPCWRSASNHAVMAGDCPQGLLQPFSFSIRTPDKLKWKGIHHLLMPQCGRCRRRASWQFWHFFARFGSCEAIRADSSAKHATVCCYQPMPFQPHSFPPSGGASARSHD